MPQAVHSQRAGSVRSSSGAVAQSVSVRVLRELGFREQRLPGYGTDPDGAPHDMSHLVLAL